MIYAFGTYELDTQVCELRCAGQPIPLTPKVYHVLAYLIRHHDRLITKDELLEQVWPQSYVDDSAVKRCIMAARRAIDDHPTSPQHIKTMRGQGYRFIAPVTRRPPDSAGAPPALRHAAEPALASDMPLPPCSLPGAVTALSSSDPGAPAPQPQRQCPGCQGVNSLTARFCQRCGMALLSVCGQCQASITMPAAFCAACGQPVTPGPLTLVPAPEAEAPTPLSERKLVTVLACVLPHMAGLVEQHGLDAVHTLMHELYTCARVAARQYEGTLQALPGEGFVLLFGIPRAQEDHARRAVLTVRALQQEVRSRCTAAALFGLASIPLSLALHTGYVTLGPPEASWQSLIVGATATLAVALARQAAPGQTIASAATARLVQDMMRSTPLPAVQVAGQSAALEVMLLVPEPAPLPLPPEGRSSGPFVGRTAELGVLQTRLSLAARGHGQVVSILGEPGIGKSRLLAEFRRTLADQPLRYVQGQCQSYGQGSPYLPLCGVLRDLWQICEGEPPAALTDKVVTGCAAFGPEATTWTPYLVHLLGGQSGAATPDLPAEELRRQTMAALHWLLSSLSRQQPCVLVLENLHWLDATSEACIAALVERLPYLPLLLLVTCRPGYRPAWLDKSYASQLALAPLAPDESRTLLRAVLRHTRLTAGVETGILQRAEGNPLFLEELAYDVAARRRARDQAPLPDSLQAVLAARIDRLPAAAKYLLQAAAVLGMEAPLPILGAVLGQPDVMLQTQLRPLQDAELLYATDLAPEPVYTFKHVLVQEVAYESLVLAERQACHRRIVAALQARTGSGAPEQLMRLAYHAHRGAMWETACDTFRQAGAQAASRSAHREAVLCFEQALDCLPHLPAGPQRDAQAIDLRFELRNVLLPLGENKRIVQLLQEAEELAQAHADRLRLGWVACYLSAEYFMLGFYEQARRMGERALALSPVDETSAMQVVAQLRLGQLYHIRGDYTQGMRVLRHNRARLSVTGRSERFGLAGLPAVHSLVWLAWCCAEVGAFTEGLDCGSEAMQIAREAARPYDLLMAYCAPAMVHIRQGEGAAAIAVLEPGLELAQRVALPLLQPLVATLLGEAYALSGRAAAALPLLEPIMERARTEPAPLTAGHNGIRLSYVYLQLGRLEEAAQLAQWVHALCSARQERGHVAYALWLLGDITAQREPAGSAQSGAHYQQAIRLARSLGMQPLLAACLLGLGTHYGQQGQPEQARLACRDALTLYRRLGMPSWQARAEATLHQIEAI
ncbi:MAG: AAA family ATPase [Candidatus Tectimicrobiota bacterium]